VVALLALEVGADNEGSRSRHHGVCLQGGFRFHEAGQRRINLVSGLDSVHGRCSPVESSTEARGAGCIGGSRSGQVWIRSVPSKVSSGYVSCSSGLGLLHALQAGLVGRSVGRRHMAQSRLCELVICVQEIDQFQGWQLGP